MLSRVDERIDVEREPIVVLTRGRVHEGGLLLLLELQLLLVLRLLLWRGLQALRVRNRLLSGVGLPRRKRLEGVAVELRAVAVGIGRGVAVVGWRHDRAGAVVWVHEVGGRAQEGALRANSVVAGVVRWFLLAAYGVILFGCWRGRLDEIARGFG